MADRMPPPPGKPGKPGVMIAIGVPKRGDGKMPPPDSDDDDQGAEDGGGAKESPKDAMVISGDLAAAMGLSPNPVCGKCSMFTGNSCTKVEGDFQPDDRCLKYWEPKGGHEEPDADEYGGPSDNDSDDMIGNAGALR